VWMLSWAVSLFERPSLWEVVRLSALVLVVASPPDVLLVAPQWSAVEPLVHPPEAVKSARVGGIRVVDDAVLACERAHTWPLARERRCIGSAHGREDCGAIFTAL